MADITLSTGVFRPGILHAIGDAIAGVFARHRWQRFQQEAATLNDRLLTDIGIDRGAKDCGTSLPGGGVSARLTAPEAATPSPSVRIVPRRTD